MLFRSAGSGAHKQQYDNSIRLMPLMSRDLMDILIDTGFKDIRFYGDFNHSPYNDQSYLLVAMAAV